MMLFDRNTWNSTRGGIPGDVVANMIDSNIGLSEFEFQLCYYVHFRINTFEERVDQPPLSSCPAMA